MKVEIERVNTVNIRNLVGHDASDLVVRRHEEYIARSTCLWLGRADGIEACLVGLIPTTIFSPTAYLWMTHTRICEQHPLRFIRWSKKLIEEALQVFPDGVYGLCLCDNEAAQQWLKWLGAEILPANRSYVAFRIR